jgi:hypothetical protein
MTGEEHAAGSRQSARELRPQTRPALADATGARRRLLLGGGHSRPRFSPPTGDRPHSRLFTHTGLFSNKRGS